MINIKRYNFFHIPSKNGKYIKYIDMIKFFTKQTKEDIEKLKEIGEHLK
jgi:hypothetical protein